jgi:hypothetical protein
MATAVCASAKRAAPRQVLRSAKSKAYCDSRRQPPTANRQPLTANQLTVSCALRPAPLPNVRIADTRLLAIGYRLLAMRFAASPAQSYGLYFDPSTVVQ